jgi:adenine-specific DNA-methyltransferase
LNAAIMTETRTGTEGWSDIEINNYNEESFLVRRAYFVGQAPYESLRRALKAEIDEMAWDEVNSTISRPFPKPASGR